MSEPLLVPPKQFSLELFVDNEFVEENNLDCSICLNVMNDSHQCRKGHSFCRDCLTEVLSKNEVCPECREKTTLQSISSCLLAKNMIDRADVYCFTRLEALQKAADENDDVSAGAAAGNKRKRTGKATKTAKSDHCTWTGKFYDARTHFDDCEHAGSMCKNDGCPAIVRRKDMAGHEISCPFRTQPCQWCQKRFPIIGSRGHRISISDHEDICEKREVKCVHAHHGCKAVMWANMKAQHLANDCMYEMVACPFSTVGCDGWMMRKDIDSHEEAAAKQHNRLMLQDIQSLRQKIEEQEEKSVEQDETIQSLLKKTTEQEALLHVIMLSVNVVDILRGVNLSLWSSQVAAEGYRASLAIDTGYAVNGNCCGIRLLLENGPFPCRIFFTFEVVHWDGNHASVCKREFVTACNQQVKVQNCPQMIALSQLADIRSPYVNNHHVTFIAKFRILPAE